MRTNTDIITNILSHEGGFVDDPSDRGGATNWGITQVQLSAWIGYPATRQDVRNLAKSAARDIYLSEYIEKPKFDQIEDWKLRNLIVDCGVNHGPGRAAKWLQRAAGVVADGVVGPKTLAVVNHVWTVYDNPADIPSLFYGTLKQRIRFYGEIVRRDPSQARFISGWLRRATSFLV